MVSLPSQISAFCALAARSPCICSLANIGVLRADRAQPLYLLTPPGRFGPSAQVPTGHTLPSGAPAGRFGPLAQVPTGHTLPFAPCRGLGQTPGRSIVAEGAGRAHRSFRSPPSGALRCAQQPTGLTLPSGAPSPVPQHKKASVASARRAQETRLAQPLPEYQRKRRGHPPPGGAAPPLFQKTLSFGKTRVSRVPSVARNARRALPPEAPPSSRLFLHQAAFLASLRSLATLDGLCRRKRRRPPAYSCIKPRFSRPFGRSQRSTGFAAGNAGVLLRLPASSRVSCSLRSLATLTAFAAAEVFGALPQTPARA